MKAISSIVLVFLLGTMFVSLFHMTIGMDMVGSMPDCPFMTHEEVLCPMDLASHLSAWKLAFQVTTPFVILLIAMACVALVSPHFFAPKLERIPIVYRRLREKIYTFTYRPLQELFANGILHPKVF
jgi:hypothetical protein